MHYHIRTDKHCTRNEKLIGTMTDTGSVKTGMYLAMGRLYTGIADCERWPVDRLCPRGESAG